MRRLSSSRPRAGGWRRWARRALIGVLILWAASAVVDRTGWTLPERPARELYRLSRRLHNLGARDKVHLLITFDEDTPIEWVTKTPLLQSGVKRVPGRIGHARQFDGHQRTFVASAADWATVGEQFTLSVWLRLEDASPYQRILYADAHEIPIGLHLENGAMTLSLPDQAVAVAYPFTRYGEFVHVAAVVDGVEGVAALYEDGVLKQREAIDSVGVAHHNIVLGMCRWYWVRMPLHGVLDETVIWRRALSPEAIRKVAARRGSLLPSLMPATWAVHHAQAGARRVARTMASLMDAFNVFLHPGYAMAEPLPEVHLYLSNADLRYFISAHTRSAMTGVLDDEAAKARRIEYGFEAAVGQGKLRLYQDGRAYGEAARRQAYVLTAEPEARILGASRVLLRPPEDADLLEPLVTTALARQLALPHTSNTLCRLFVNGHLRGVYYAEDFDRMGMFPGQWTGNFLGPEHPAKWPDLFVSFKATESPLSPLGDTVPLSRHDSVALYDAVMKSYQRVLRNDPFMPLGSGQLRRRLYRGRRAWAQRSPRDGPDAQTVADALTPFMAIGANPSPFFVVTDLELDRFRTPGIVMTWQSSDPGIVTPHGVVTRPSTAPVAVDMTAIIYDGKARVTKTLRFRVMPDPLTLPAMMLYARDPLMHINRADARIDFYPAGSDGLSPQRFTAMQAGGGGIAHRGNTGVWKTKKPFSVRMDNAHGLLDESDTRHLYLASGYADQTFMRNAFVYGLFRSFSTAETQRHAPVVTWTEVFVNGAYHGLYELGTRIHRRHFGFPAYRPWETEDPGLIYKVLDVIQGFRHLHPTSVMQKYPQLRHGYHLDPYFRLLRTLSDTEQDDRFARFASVFDADSAVDFQLLLDLTEGSDNMNVNFYVVRNPGPDQRFYFVAWDKKRCYQGSSRAYPHHLLRPFVVKTPEFQRRLRSRWMELRTGVASHATLLQALDAMEQNLNAYAHWDYDRWGYNDNQSFTALVEALRDCVIMRRDWMDAQFFDAKTQAEP